MRLILRKQSGVTLLELTFVVLIMSILSIPIARLLDDKKERSAIDETIDGIRILAEAAYTYRQKYMAWPADINVLKSSNILPILNIYSNGWGQPFSVSTSGLGMVIKTKALNLSQARAVADSYPVTSSLNSSNFEVTVGIGVPGTEAAHDALLPRDGSKPMTGNLDLNNNDLVDANRVDARTVSTTTVDTYTLQSDYIDSKYIEASSRLETPIIFSDRVIGGTGDHEFRGSTWFYEPNWFYGPDNYFSNIRTAFKSVGDTCLVGQIAVNPSDELLVCESSTRKFKSAVGGSSSGSADTNGWADIGGGLRLHWGDTGTIQKNVYRTIFYEGSFNRVCLRVLVNHQSTQSSFGASQLSALGTCINNTSIRVTNIDNESGVIAYMVITRPL